MKDNNKFKNKNNQSSQKIEPYGSLTTKELKKKHSSKPVGGVETGSRVERTGVGKAAAGGLARWQIADWVVPHSRADNWEEQWGSETDRTTQSSVWEIKPQTSH